VKERCICGKAAEYRCFTRNGWRVLCHLCLGETLRAERKTGLVCPWEPIERRAA